MNLKIYNSLTNSIEEFRPQKNKKLSLYVCGPTVYDFIHIGNARPVLFFDMLRRYFIFNRYEVKYITNITDVDDKIIDRAAKIGENEVVFAQKYSSAFLKNINDLGCLMPDKITYATQYISQMDSLIQKLMAKDFAYYRDGDVYFRIDKAARYGVLSNQNTEDLISGARIEVNTKKESPLDFTLWKNTTRGIKYKSSFGEGRPGWHTECVCMINENFEGTIDIHGGGFDLKFPHHENEIAQYEAIYNQPLANYFMHVGRLDYDGEKMSKSLGNVLYVENLAKQNLLMPLRLCILMQKYRHQFDFSEKLFSDYIKDYERIIKAYKNGMILLDLKNIRDSKIIENDLMEFRKWMEDDFNTPNVYTLILRLVKEVNIFIKEENLSNLADKLITLKAIMKILGFNLKYRKMSISNQILYKNWQNARAIKDFDLADKYRKNLEKKGLL